MIKVYLSGATESRGLQSGSVHHKMLKALGTGACLFAVSMAFGGTAWAQQGSDPTLDEIQVTGSRIQRTGMTTPTPVTTMTAEDLTDMAPTTLMDAMNQMPQFFNNDTPETSRGSWTGSAGQSILNLRGIGANRTLVLLDGRRVVGSTQQGLVDINLFPSALVRRVDVVTGGASAAYGSDAVSGVANFILDTDYVGVKGNIQGGITSRGDQANHKFSLAAGSDVGERGHILVAGEYFHANEIRGYSKRDWYRNWSVINNPDGPPSHVVAPDVHVTNSTPGGLIVSGPLAGTQFLEDGTPAPFFKGDYYTPQTQVGGSGWDPSYNNTLVPEQERYTLFSHFSYDVSDNVKAFVQGIYGSNRVDYDNGAVTAASGFPGAATIYADNAFLPDSIRQQMIDLDLDSFQLGTVRARDELSKGRTITQNNTISLTAGLEGDINERWQFNAYYQYGHNKQDMILANVMRNDRFWAAIDSVVDPATGNVACRITVEDPDKFCIPVNLFGAHSASQEAMDWILDTEHNIQKVTQHVAEASVSGEAFDIWAGPVSVAAGIGYRDESMSEYGIPEGITSTDYYQNAEGARGVPPILIGGGLFERGSIPVLSGSGHVLEAFGETIVPLLTDQAFAQSLSFNGSVRYADYSGSGGIWAWKLGLDWQVNDELRFRGTRSRDVRAGTLAEHFTSRPRGGSVEDPFLPGHPNYGILRNDNGNPRISPEKGDTLTFGAVYRPDWLSGFSISTDFYNIKISDAIDVLGIQRILDGCYEGDASLCDLVHRDPSTGRVASIDNTYLNLSKAHIRGVDFEGTYLTPIAVLGGDETLNLRALVSFIDKYTLTTPAGQLVDETGQTGTYGHVAPKWQANLSVNYTNGPLSVFVQERYIDSGTYRNDYVEGVDIDDNTIDSAWYTTARISYDFEALGSQSQVFFNVNNVFDKTPPPIGNVGLFDDIGRRFTAGLRFEY